MSYNVIVDSDYNTNILARRLKAMGYTVKNINAAYGIIECENPNADIKKLNRERGVRDVETNG